MINVFLSLIFLISSQLFVQTDPVECKSYDEIYALAQTLFQHDVYDATLDLLDCAIELEPDNPQALTFRSFVHLRLYQLDDALADAAHVVELTSVDSPLYAPNLLLMATLYTYLEQHEQATEVITVVIDLDETEAMDEYLSEAYSQLGQIAVLLDEPSRAIEDLTNAVTYDPEAAFALYFRGVAYEMIGEDDLAQSDWDRAIELNPNISQEFASAGSAYLNVENYQRAIWYYDLAIASDSTGDWKYYALRGVSYYWLEQYDKVVEEMTYVLDSDPNSREALFFRGCANAELGDYNAAIDDLTQVASVYPDFSDTYLCRGNAYYGQGSFDLALSDYQTYISLVDTDENAINSIAIERIQELNE
jgi:tetratricopeptide (TPR) repeat protein